jgi:alkylation response protein AidB-like acyl-CoA dehydrogenase
MPTSALDVHDTWRVSGLAGTASNDFGARDLFVPAAHAFKLADPATTRPEAICRMPPGPWFTAHLAAVSLGIARGALDELIELAERKVPTFSTVVLAERPAAQVELARAETSVAAARAFLHETLESVWQVVQAGGQLTPRQSALARMAAVNAAEVGAQVTRTVGVLAGGSAIFSASPFQRHLRDAEAITHHFTVAPYVVEDAGRVFLGRRPLAPLF